MLPALLSRPRSAPRPRAVSPLCPWGQGGPDSGPSSLQLAVRSPFTSRRVPRAGDYHTSSSSALSHWIVIRSVSNPGLCAPQGRPSPSLPGGTPRAWLREALQHQGRRDRQASSHKSPVPAAQHRPPRSPTSGPPPSSRPTRSRREDSPPPPASVSEDRPLGNKAAPYPRPPPVSSFPDPRGRKVPAWGPTAAPRRRRGQLVPPVTSGKGGLKAPAGRKLRPGCESQPCPPNPSWVLGRCHHFLLVPSIGQDELCTSPLVEIQQFFLRASGTQFPSGSGCGLLGRIS